MKFLFTKNGFDSDIRNMSREYAERLLSMRNYEEEQRTGEKYVWEMIEITAAEEKEILARWEEENREFNLRWIYFLIGLMIGVTIGLISKLPS